MPVWKWGQPYYLINRFRWKLGTGSANFPRVCSWAIYLPPWHGLKLMTRLGFLSVIFHYKVIFNIVDAPLLGHWSLATCILTAEVKQAHLATTKRLRASEMKKSLSAYESGEVKCHPCSIFTSLVDLFSGDNSFMSINRAGSDGNWRPLSGQGAVPPGHLATAEHVDTAALAYANDIFLTFSPNTLSFPDSCPFSVFSIGMAFMNGSASAAGSTV